MKIKPILFSAPMIKAILEGQKTQTRRVIKPQPNFDSAWKNYGKTDLPEISVAGSLLGVNNGKGGVGCCVPNISIKIHKGDILWVRETFAKLHPVDEDGYTDFDSELIFYRADGEPDIVKYDADGSEIDDQWMKWKPSIFMPKAACRIFLEVINVRVEKLIDISWEDAVSEGCSGYRPTQDEPTHQFKRLWEFINGKESWKENPWVWVYDFKRVEKHQNFII